MGKEFQRLAAWGKKVKIVMTCKMVREISCESPEKEYTCHINNSLDK